MAKSGKNKARNQVGGSTDGKLGSVNAPWFSNNVKKRRKKNKQAAKSRRANRKK